MVDMAADTRLDRIQRLRKAIGEQTVANPTISQAEAIYDAVFGGADQAAGSGPTSTPPNPDNLEIVNGWLVERGAHELEYPAGAAYGFLPYSDAEPLLNLAELPGWPKD